MERAALDPSPPQARAHLVLVVAAAFLVSVTFQACRGGDQPRGAAEEGARINLEAVQTRPPATSKKAAGAVARPNPAAQATMVAVGQPLMAQAMSAGAPLPPASAPAYDMTYVPGLVPAPYGNAGAQGMPLPDMFPATGRTAQPESTTESYEYRWDNPFLPAAEAPLSTFALDVDTASLANVRRFLEQGTLPPLDAVRIEELINYFEYSDAPPTDDVPFAVHVESAPAPWALEHRLVRMALTTRPIAQTERPAANLVLLLDVSGSMNDPRKLPLVKAGLKLLVDQLREDDHVAVVVYAGEAGLVLPSTSGADKEAILHAIASLEPGGSTAGAEGIQLAYREARKSFVPEGVNRVLLATDGDFNVGISSREELIDLISKEAADGIFLTTLGFGMGNLKDETLESLADRGNGNYAYIDGMSEARKVFLDEIGQNLVTVAKDVKIQVEFNPAAVKGYRLLGYENRLLAAADFNDDTKDGGEVGAGHVVTVLYEIVPAGQALPLGPTSPPTPTPDTGTPSPDAVVDPLRYLEDRPGELLTVKLRYKEPEGATSTAMDYVMPDMSATHPSATTEDWRFSAAVAAFGMLLRDSPYKGMASYAVVRELAAGALGEDPRGLRKGFLDLVDKAERLTAVASGAATPVPPGLPDGPPDAAYPYP